MQFEIKALRSGEGVSVLSISALNESDATNVAKSQGYAVLSVKAAGKALIQLKPRSAFPLVLFSQELLSLLEAGLSLIEALVALANKERNSDSKKVLDSVISRLYEGQTFSAALQEFQEIFPPLYIASIRASEKTGGLNEALSRFVSYQTQLNFVKKKIVSASIYPVVLMAAGGLVMLFLLGYVVPRFSAVYEGARTSLPWMSQVLLKWGAMLHNHGMLMLAVVATCLLGAIYCLSRQSVREALLTRLWRIPALGERMHIYQLARFYRTLAMLLKGGIPAVTALDMVSGLLQPALRGKLILASNSIREGWTISQAMEAHELTTPVALSMLRVGERSGNMGEMMERIATFYDEEMARWVEWFTKLFEPILMAVIGVVIGVIVVLMYMPIFDLAGSIQ
ncbi:type II secretion system F family protein [Sideroxydans sp. CL21]|uniref:type II secretion system F family protein n=1 Tax=Sideroxydans sp. CL21 TaxID=2600596 RepID=UPI0024BC09F8|nr:type II secretion system F family protein [Sideroxydans sp. CL21]